MCIRDSEGTIVAVVVEETLYSDNEPELMSFAEFLTQWQVDNPYILLQNDEDLEPAYERYLSDFKLFPNGFMANVELYDVRTLEKIDTISLPGYSPRTVVLDEWTTEEVPVFKIPE